MERVTIPRRKESSHQPTRIPMYLTGVGGGWASQQPGASEDSKQYLKEVERRDNEMVRACLQWMDRSIDDVQSINQWIDGR